MVNRVSLLGRLGKSQACWTGYRAGPTESCLGSVLVKLCTFSELGKLVGLYVTDP